MDSILSLRGYSRMRLSALRKTLLALVLGLAPSALVTAQADALVFYTNDF